MLVNIWIRRSRRNAEQLLLERLVKGYRTALPPKAARNAFRIPSLDHPFFAMVPQGLQLTMRYCFWPISGFSFISFKLPHDYQTGISSAEP
jgi:hypothetical protein